MLLERVTINDVKKCVEAFNSRYSEMERALWCLSRSAAKDIMKNKHSPTIEKSIWIIKSWWGIPEVRKETKSMAAQALLDLRLNDSLLTTKSSLDPKGEKTAVDLVSDFVSRMIKFGVSRREWSLASKVLHWLMPWRVPVYDSFVKKSLQISVDAEPESAYLKIVRTEYAVSQRLLDSGDDWLGDVEPKSPFRALDKYLWWSGGGYVNTAVVVKDPWRVIRLLGLTTR